MNESLVIAIGALCIIAGTIGTIYAISEIQDNTPSAMPNLSAAMETPTPNELGITEIVVMDCNGNIRSATMLDERTGEYRQYYSENMADANCSGIDAGETANP